MPETPLSWISYANKGESPWYTESGGVEGLEQWLETIELMGIPTYATEADLPAAGSTSTKSNGDSTQRQFAAVVEDTTVYRDNGSEWVPWMNHYTDSDAVDAVNNDADHGSTASHNYFSGSHDDLSGVSSDDHHAQVHDNADHSTDYLPQSSYTPESDTHDRYTDGEAQTAINNDPDHGSTASHNYFSGSHDDLSNVSSGDHHTRYSDSEARGAVAGNVNIEELVTASTASGYVARSQGDGTLLMEQPLHGDLGGISSNDHHDRYTDGEVVTAVNNDADHGSTASHNYFSGSHDDLINVASDDHHARYSDEEVQDTINALLTGGTGINLTYDDANNNLTIDGVAQYTDEDAQDAVGLNVGNALTYDDASGSVSVNEGGISHDNLSGVSSDDHHAQVHDNTDHSTDYLPQSSYNPESDTHDRYSDSEAQSAINNDSDHGSTAPHNYFSGSHDDLSGVSSSDHHTRYSNSEAQSAVEGSVNIEDLITASATAGHIPRSQGDGTLLMESLGHGDLTGVSSSDHHTKYTDSEAVSAVNAESSLSVDISGDADTVDGNHASAFATSGHSHAHDDLTSVGSDDHHAQVHNNSDHSTNYLPESNYTPESDTHSRYSDSEAISAINNDTDHGSTASHNYFSGSHDDLSSVGSSDHHTKYTDSEAVSAVNAETSLSVDISGDADTVDGSHASSFASSGHSHAHSDITSVNSDDHHSRYSDSEAQTAINNDPDHGSTASHNYFSGAHDDLSSVGSDDHHAQAHDNADHSTNYLPESNYNPEADTHSKTTSGEIVHDDTQGGTNSDAHHNQVHDNSDHSTNYLPESEYSPGSPKDVNVLDYGSASNADSALTSAVSAADPHDTLIFHDNTFVFTENHELSKPVSFEFINAEIDDQRANISNNDSLFRWNGPGRVSNTTLSSAVGRGNDIITTTASDFASPGDYLYIEDSTASDTIKTQFAVVESVNGNDITLEGVTRRNFSANTNVHVAELWDNVKAEGADLISTHEEGEVFAFNWCHRPRAIDNMARQVGRHFVQFSHSYSPVSSGCEARAAISTEGSQGEPFITYRCTDVTFRDTRAQGVRRGIDITNGTTGATIINPHIENFTIGGVSAHNGDAISDVTVVGGEIYSTRGSDGPCIALQGEATRNSVYGTTLVAQRTALEIGSNCDIRDVNISLAEQTSSDPQLISILGDNVSIEADVLVPTYTQYTTVSSMEGVSNVDLDLDITVEEYTASGSDNPLINMNSGTSDVEVRGTINSVAGFTSPAIRMYGSTGIVENIDISVDIRGHGHQGIQMRGDTGLSSIRIHDCFIDVDDAGIYAYEYDDLSTCEKLWINNNDIQSGGIGVSLEMATIDRAKVVDNEGTVEIASGATNTVHRSRSLDKNGTDESGVINFKTE